MTDYARRIEAAGFPGIWVGASLGRGRPTLDPLIELSVLAAVTERVELGISVLKVNCRCETRSNWRHRVQSGYTGLVRQSAAAWGRQWLDPRGF